MPAAVAEHRPDVIEAPRGTDIAELTARELDVLTGKLGLRDRAAAIVYAYDNGIVAPR